MNGNKKFPEQAKAALRQKFKQIATEFQPPEGSEQIIWDRIQAAQEKGIENLSFRSDDENLEALPN